jgi:hypothetical protein
MYKVYEVWNDERNYCDYMAVIDSYKNFAVYHSENCMSERYKDRPTLTVCVRCILIDAFIYGRNINQQK